MKSIVVSLILLFTVQSAWADQWAAATVRTYESSRGQFRLTVFPRDLWGARPHSYGKSRGKELAGQRLAGPTRCEATLERLVGDHYEELWRKPLVNDVAPLSALVSDADGAFVTFDNWHRIGWGDDPIVIYTGSGELIRKIPLTDIMSKKEFDDLPRSMSSIYWGGEHYLERSGGPIVNLRILARGPYSLSEMKKREYQTVRIRLDTGELVRGQQGK